MSTKDYEQDRPNPEVMELLIRLNLKAECDPVTRKMYRNAFFSACLGSPPRPPALSARWFWALHDRLPKPQRPVFLFDWRIEIDRLRETDPKAAARLAGHSMKASLPGSIEENALSVSFHDALAKIQPNHDAALRLARRIFTENPPDPRKKQFLCAARQYLKTRNPG